MAASSDNHLLQLHHVSRFYGLVVGLNDVCLELSPGGYGLIGPNGSGKTTLLHLLTGFLRPTIGSLRVYDRNPWKHRDSLLRRIGYCPAADGLYSSITAWQWVAHLLEVGSPGTELEFAL